MKIQNVFKYFSAIGLSILILSCGVRYTKKTITGVEINEELRDIKVINGFQVPENPVDYKLLFAEITDSILTIKVSYSGGCEDHDFDLIFNGMYMKSLPRQGSLYLQHESNGDKCKKLVETTLKFNLSPIIGTSKQATNYNLHSYEERLKYINE